MTKSKVERKTATLQLMLIVTVSSTETIGLI